MMPISFSFILSSFLVFPLSATGQQYGSFYTAIYIENGGVNAEVPCANMGYSNYCCASGQYCSLDGNSAIACCASGVTCCGVAGGYEQCVPSSTWIPTYTQTVTTQQNVVPAYVTVTTTIGYQVMTTTVTAISSPTITTQGFVVVTPTTTLPTLTTAQGVITTVVENPATCGSFSTIIAQGDDLPATRNCIVFISAAPRIGGFCCAVLAGISMSLIFIFS